MQNTTAAPHEQVFSRVLGFWQARALVVATEIGVPDLLAEGPLYVDELAASQCRHELSSAFGQSGHDIGSYSRERSQFLVITGGGASAHQWSQPSMVPAPQEASSSINRIWERSLCAAQ